MNILVITQMYSQPDDIGDNKPTKTVNYFVKEWVAMGHDVVVMHCPSKFPLPFYLVPTAIKEKFAGRISTMVPPIESRKDLHRMENGADIYRFPMFKPYPGMAYSRNSMTVHAKKIIKTLEARNFKPDIVIGHFANPSTELVPLVAEYYSAKSSIVFHHDCVQNVEKYRIRELAPRIGAIGARSVIEAQEVQKVLDLKELPFVCCSGVPNDAVEVAETICNKHDFTNGVKYIYVGSLIKRKHLDAVIKAFVNSAKEGSTLKVVGGGPEEQTLKALVDSLNANDRITFTGRVSREQVLQEMKDAQVFTLISHDETYGMVYIEAMLQGCLVIASKGEGFDGIIKNGENGFICEPGNEHELAEIYKTIQSMDFKDRNRIGQAAIDLAIHFSEKEVAERYLEDILIKNS